MWRRFCTGHGYIFSDMKHWELHEMIGRRIPMKKTIVLALALILVCMFTVSAVAEPLQVAVVQLAENGAFKDMREGFIARMRELGYTEDKMTFVEKNASGDMSNLYTIAQSVVEEEMDLIVTIATPAAQAVVNLESDIPVFFISVANPLGAGVITDMQKPDKTLPAPPTPFR